MKMFVRHSQILWGLLLGLLSSCSSLPYSTLSEWQSFSQQVDQLGFTELVIKNDELLRAHNSKPSDQSRLYLGYVLSRPQNPVRDLEKSRQLLSEIGADSRYSPLKILLQKQIEQMIEVAAHSIFIEWSQFVEQVEQLQPADYFSFREQLLLSYQNSPDDGIRLRLSYLLSRPNADTQDLQASVELLDEIGTDSIYLWLRIGLFNEVNLMRRLNAAKARLSRAEQSIEELQTQLKMLKTIDGDLTESQREIDEISQ